MTTTGNTPRKTTRYPKPLAAAAGAGELALEQLRKLPETATRLSGRVRSELNKFDLAEVRDDLGTVTDKVKAEVSQLRTRIDQTRRKSTAEVRRDADKARDNAQTAVNEFVDTAQRQLRAATKQAAEFYDDLAARGVKVLSDTRVGRASGRGGSHAAKPAAPKPLVRKATRPAVKSNAKPTSK